MRFTEGVSWQSAPGVRRWRSVSYGLGSGFLGACVMLFWYGLAWPFFIIPLWIMFECLFLFVTALICVTGMIVYQTPPESVRVIRIKWFWIFDLELPPGR